jgi:hypothetical protein
MAPFLGSMCKAKRAAAGAGGKAIGRKVRDIF